MAEKLTPKQERFCNEYLIDLNATQAAIRAGYSESGAAVEGHRLLTNANIQDYISDLNKDRQESTGVSARMVIEELAKIAFSDIRDVLTVDNGLRDISMLDEKTAKAISSIKITEDKSMGEVIGETKEVKLWDKLRALDSLGKHFGIFERDNSQKKTDNVTIFELPNNGRDKTD